MNTEGDSRKVGHQKLSASLAFQEIEAARKKAGISQAALAVAAGISRNTYLRYLRRPGPVRPVLLAKLRRALRALEKAKAAPSKLEALTLASYAGFLEMTARHYGVTADEVRAASPQRGATASAHWKACAHARQAAIYLVNVGLGIEQARIAAMLGLTPAAVCLALKDVEDRRDDGAFDRMIIVAQRALTGREE
jgi:transcriptional regulator with XRE-family HTH domain